MTGEGPQRGAKLPGGMETVPLPGDGLRSSTHQRRLLVLGEEGVVVHALPDEGALSIGRADEADVTIDRESISRRHAVLHLSERMELEDVGSSNGTRVGGRRLTAGERVVVGPGDHVELGGTTVLLQAPLDLGSDSEGVSGPSGVSEVAAKVARSELSVLLTGETGVGKEVFARRIHEMSPRGEGPFVPLNCGALSEELLASELFGHVAGAFTGARADKPGLLETAQGGTVFLDEVGEMPMSQQVKLLRVLEERRVMRVGGLSSTPIDVRFVSATNRDLRQEVSRGSFREDLYYRLNGITLRIPPLRERVGEIEGLARLFMTDAASRAGLPAPAPLSAEALSALQSHAWPGNVRELKNVIERAVVLAGEEPVRPDHLFEDVGSELLPSSGEAPDERTRILQALQQTAGNQTRAAELLGISRRTLGTKMDTFGIARPQKSRRK